MRPTFDRTGGTVERVPPPEASDPKRALSDALAEVSRSARGPIPPAPLGWNKTVADVIAEAKGAMSRQVVYEA